MRIAFVINDLSGGGAEKVVELLARHLVDRGWQIRIYTLHGTAPAYDFPPTVDIVALSHRVPGSGFGKLMSLPLFGWALARELRSWAPVVCVSNLPRANIAHVLTRLFGNKAPVILTEHAETSYAYPQSGVANAVMRLLIKALYPKANLVLCVSGGVASGLRKLGVPSEKVAVALNPVSITAIRGRAAEAVSREDAALTIINVGRYTDQKDQSTLITAFARLRRLMAARLVLVGEGPDRKRLEALVAHLELGDSVTFAGWQANPYAWMSNADIFVLSSKFEGFGNVLVEAMACGLPVISTDCPSGPSEVVAEGEVGLLVPVGDVDALAEAMIKLARQPMLRAELAAKSLRRAPDFDISVLGPAYADLLERVASKPKLSPVRARTRGKR